MLLFNAKYYIFEKYKIIFVSYKAVCPVFMLSFIQSKMLIIKQIKGHTKLRYITSVDSELNEKNTNIDCLHKMFLTVI